MFMNLEQILRESTPELDAFAKRVMDAYGLERFNLHMDRQGNIELASIQLAKDAQGSGAGTHAMKALVDFADQNQSLIWLSVAEKDSKTGTTSKGRLKKFYKRFGFVENKGRNKRFDLSLYANMYREPR